MTVLPIRIVGDPVLHRPAEPVTEFTDDLRLLIADMFETMAAAPGVGLAAPQVGVPLQLFVYSYPDAQGLPRQGVAVNPELWITPPPVGAADADTEAEGCLSVPSERFPLRRAERAILRAHDASGKPFEISAHGWFARIFQHEFDHLNGILYLDRLTNPHLRKARKAIAKNGWGEPGHSWHPGVDILDA